MPEIDRHEAEGPRERAGRILADLGAKQAAGRPLDAIDRHDLAEAQRVGLFENGRLSAKGRALFEEENARRRARHGG